MSEMRKALEASLAAVRVLNARVERLDHERVQPIAIVSMGCRFPSDAADPADAADPESFWQLLRDGVDAISEVPSQRWDIDQWYDPAPDAAGKMNSRWGGFLKDIDQFDPAFFGISEFEAANLDPQQRLLLEVSWEALERAGLTLEQLMDCPVGVYVGICSNEYQALALSDVSRINPYSYLGTAHSATAGRLSYWLGLRGPNVPVDTACSSSLVAVHLACQALRVGECDMALAGGVNLIVSPHGTICLSKMQALSPTGRCRTFDASADGYVRSEGCGMLVLKRLSEAQADGDPILAVIRGTAVNQDGRSQGPTAPNGPAQQEVIRRALEQAQVAPAAVGYVETHGTGTFLGDPIEVQALASVLGEGRTSDQPVVIGSAKSNIGHGEAVAGVTGLIKAVLVLQHGAIPPTIHFEKPNPHIPWDELPVHVADKLMPWPADGAPRIAGVSSFGFSGTNVHIILEEVPTPVQQEEREALKRPQHLVTLSARNTGALVEQARRLGEHLVSHPKFSLEDVAFSLSTTRTHYPQRLALPASSREELLEKLSALVKGEQPAGCAVSRNDTRSSSNGKTAFLFSGQGVRYVGMGRELYETQPVFRECLDRCARLLEPQLEKPLLEVMFALSGDEPGGLLDQPRYTQPALFALEYALWELWRSWGVKPDVLMGHGVGEVVAACAAGVFHLEDGIELIAARGRFQQELPPGSMVLVGAEESQVADALLPYAETVAIAAVNGLFQTVISGRTTDVAEIASRFAARGVKTTDLGVSHGFHSPLAEPGTEAFQKVAEAIAYQTPQLSLISNVSGAPAGEEIAHACYWVRHARETVRFRDGMQTLQDYGVRTFLELGPQPTLLALGAACLPDDVQASWLPSLEKGCSDWSVILSSLAEWYCHGRTVDWRSFEAPYSGRRVDLPTYPFQRQRFWLDMNLPSARAGEDTGHPLLGVSVSLAGADAVFETWLSSSKVPFLADHCVFGQVIVPAAAQLEMVRAAAEAYFGPGIHAIEQMELLVALVVPEDSARLVQVVLSESSGEAADFRLYSRPEGEKPQQGRWICHSTGRLRVDATGEQPTGIELSTLVDGRLQKDDSIAEIYAERARAGVVYGPTFQVLKEVWVGDGEAVGHLVLPKSSNGVRQESYGLHPALLDGVLQVVGLTVSSEPAGKLYLPVEVGSMKVYAIGSTEVWVRVTAEQTEMSAGLLNGTATVWDIEGQVVARLDGLRFKLTDAATIREQHSVALPDCLYKAVWRRMDSVPISRAGDEVGLDLEGGWVIISLGTQSEEAKQLIRHLQDGGAEVHVCADPGEMETVILESARGKHGISTVVIFFNPDATEDDALAAEETSISGLEYLQRLVRAAESSEELVSPRLCWVTMGSQAVSHEESPELSSAALWGLGRVWLTEFRDWPTTLVDLDPRGSVNENVRGLLQILDDVGWEPQVAVRGSELFVARLSRAPAEGERAKLPVPDSESYRLVTDKKGLLDHLRLEPSSRRSPKEGEVEIEVEASGLNFRDVLNALGMYPGDAGPLGGEFAGRVVTVGDNVSHVSPGDLVIGLAPASFSRYVTADAQLISRRPRGMTAEQAASIPIAFLTAWYALRDLADLRQGERVLIHAAAGGVGMAAVQVAQLCGAEIFATASPHKWETLRRQGVHHIASSRTLDFVDVFREAIGGKDGIGVVLNSLAGEYVDASLSLLSERGRFIEIGKVDIRSAENLAASHNAITYRAFDLAEAGMGRIHQMFGEVVEAFESGQLQPLPVRCFSILEAESAFRCMAQAKHVGKIVFTPAAPAVDTASVIRPNSTVLVTGGLGAIGLQVAQWLVAEQGVSHLVLVGRHTPDGEKLAAVEALGQGGARVSIVQADVTAAAQMEDVLRNIPEDLPLRGVFHLAGVIDDSLLAEQDERRFRRVMAPKVEGAWHLHKMTIDEDLDVFVLFSSIASILGTGGQANYAAANAFLDALAQRRSNEGLPGISLQWGPWAGQGMARVITAEHEARLSRQGLRTITVTQGLELLGQAVSRSEAQLAIVPIDTTALRKVTPEGAVPAFYRELVGLQHRSMAGATATPGVAPISGMQHLSKEELTATLAGAVSIEAARVLALPDQSELPFDVPFQELGLDSLSLWELRKAIERRIGRTLPNSVLFDYPTMNELVAFLVGKIPRSREDAADDSHSRRVRSVEATPPSNRKEGQAITDAAGRFPSPELRAPVETSLPAMPGTNQDGKRRRGATAADIRAHYDVGNEFYALFLDPARQYSCALWEVGDETFEAAQSATLDYHIHQARANSAARVLDVGCGWGGLLHRLVDVHGVPEVTGITLSTAQSDYINESLLPKSRGRMSVLLESWKDHDPVRPYDAIISIEAIEHFASSEVSQEQKEQIYFEFFKKCHQWLEPGGFVSLQAICYGNTIREEISKFITRTVFPGTDLPCLADLARASQCLFEVVQFRNDRKQYVRTLEIWLERLRGNRSKAVQMVGQEIYERFERYLYESVFYLDIGATDLYRLTLRRIDRPVVFRSPGLVSDRSAGGSDRRAVAELVPHWESAEQSQGAGGHKLPGRRDTGIEAGENLLVPMRAKGVRPPLFLVHPMTGNPEVFVDLVRHLDSDCPIYAYQVPAGAGEVLSSIDKIAASYVSALQGVQESGPYSLIGYSAGGIIAFEMARKLEEMGQAVKGLALVDSPIPRSFADVSANMLAQGPIRLSLTVAFNLGFDVTPALVSEIRDLEGAWSALQSQIGLQGLPFSVDEVRDRLAVAEAILQAIVNYRPSSSIDAPVLVIQCGEEGKHSRAFDYIGDAVVSYDWGSLTRAGAKMVEVPGTHFSIVKEPCTPDTAAAINDFFEAWGTTPTSRMDRSDSRRGTTESWGEPDIDRFAHDYMEAWNSKDVDSVLSLYTSDVIYKDPTIGAPIQGVDELRRFVTEMFEQYDICFSIRSVASFDNREGTAVFWSAVVGAPGRARTEETDGVDVLFLRQHRVVRCESYFDPMTFARVVMKKVPTQDTLTASQRQSADE